MALSIRFPPLIPLVVLHASSAPPRPLLSTSVCFMSSLFASRRHRRSDFLSGGRYSWREFTSFFLAIVILSARSHVHSFTGGLISM